MIALPFTFYADVGGNGESGAVLCWLQNKYTIS